MWASCLQVNLLSLTRLDAVRFLEGRDCRVRRIPFDSRCAFYGHDKCVPPLAIATLRYKSNAYTDWSFLHEASSCCPTGRGSLHY